MIPLADPQRFVGRHRQLVALAEALDGRSRLVTLHGPSGVGKSRLAAEHLHAVAAERRTVAVELEDADTLRDALALTASAFEAPAAAGSDPVHVLAECLRELGPVTVVFDHIDGVSAELVDPLARWLTLCPEAHFVVTATQPLSLPVEHHPCVVEPLPLPVTRGDRTPADALRLWHMLRGSELRTGRAVEAELVELLRALSGLPLLIELLSALAEQLTPFALLERLSPKLRSLGPVPSPPAALDAVLSASLAGMAEPERRAFAQCAVFGTSFEREAFVSVQGSAGALDGLLRRRLVSRLHTTDGSERFGLHHALRRAARERLRELAPAHQAESRHAQYYVARGAALAEALEGSDGPQATRALVREQTNLLAIVARPPLAGDLADVTHKLRALCIHDQVLSTFGPVDTDAARLNRALEAAEGLAVDPVVLSEALCVRAVVRVRTGALDAGFDDLARAQALAATTQVAGSYPAGRIAVTAAFVSLAAGRLDDAEREARRAMDVATAGAHGKLHGIALGMYALVRRVRGFDAEARDLYEQALAEHRRVGNRRYEGIVMTRLAQLLFDGGDAERALTMADAARDLHRTFGDRTMEGLSLEVRGAAVAERGELEEARRVLESARPLLAAGGSSQTTGTVALLARVRAELGDFELARPLFARARDGLAERGERDEAVLCSARIAGLDALLGDVPGAEATFAQLGAPASRRLRTRIALEAGQLDLFALRQALADGDASRAERAHARAVARRDELEALCREEPARSVRAAADDRAALRTFDALLRGHPVSRPTPGLALSLATRSFVGPGGQRVDMGQRPALRRVLTRLCMEALRAPGTAQRTLTLFAAGWPGENPGPENARLQVYAALGTLRKFGLGAALVSNEAGHLLDPALAVRFA